MFSIGEQYSKNKIYEILDVPPHRRKGAWDTGYREYEGNIFIFSNIGIPGRTGHDYNNYWDGDSFVWQGKITSNINQPSIKKLLIPPPDQSIFLFTRTNDKEPFTFEGKVIVKEYMDTIPVSITWQLEENYYHPLEKLTPLNNQNFYEGEIKQITINKHERNPLARRICIDYYGICCQICNFNFYETYGELGKDFIHVHHLIPISQTAKEYKLDPLRDLIPICPNCHSMIHRKKEVLPIEELKKLVKKRAF
ncbi:MAG TPA: HNH endonuclease [Segetibacter sp.]|jgi:5-methylcytosine-specific restriction protein A